MRRARWPLPSSGHRRCARSVRGPRRGHVLHGAWEHELRVGPPELAEPAGIGHDIERDSIDLMLWLKVRGDLATYHHEADVTDPFNLLIGHSAYGD